MADDWTGHLCLPCAHKKECRDKIDKIYADWVVEEAAFKLAQEVHLLRLEVLRGHNRELEGEQRVPDTKPEEEGN
jgi:hypothetical protein